MQQISANVVPSLQSLTADLKKKKINSAELDQGTAKGRELKKANGTRKNNKTQARATFTFKQLRTLKLSPTKHCQTKVPSKVPVPKQALTYSKMCVMWGRGGTWLEIID
jgi:hypothetical protein